MICCFGSYLFVWVLFPPSPNYYESLIYRCLDHCLFHMHELHTKPTPKERKEGFFGGDLRLCLS